MADIGSSPQYTSTEAVRGALGVDLHDLPDQQILDAELDVELTLDLGTWCLGYSAKLAVGASATEAQKTLQACLRTYAKWYCATEFSLKVLTFKQVYGDGKAEQRRFGNFDWEKLATSCKAKRDTYKQQILQIDPDSAATYDGTASYSLIGRGVPAYNPVTNTNEGG